MPPAIDTQLQLAAVILAEELHYGRAARRLHIAVSTLSKQITRLEDKLGIILFVRDSKHVELTDEGAAYIKEIRTSLLQAESAVNAARAVKAKKGQVLTIGHAPYVDPELVRTLLSVRLPHYSDMQIRLNSDCAFELEQELITRELDLALVACAPTVAALKCIKVVRSPLCVILPDYHHASGLTTVSLSDLANDDWILLNRRIDPILYEATLQQASVHGIVPKHIHQIATPEEGIHLVREDIGVALVAKSAGPIEQRLGVVVKSLANEQLRLTTYLALRGDNPSSLVHEFTQEILKVWTAAGLPQLDD